MSPRGLLRILQTRWVTLLVTTALVIVGALILGLRTPSMYEASTTLFVSSKAGENAADLYEGGLFSQARVQSYAELIKDDTLALRTIGKLGLPMSVDDWKAQVSAGAKPGTVLIDVRVRDTSAIRARDIANTLSDEFVVMVGELETVRPGDAAIARVIVAKRATTPTRPVVEQPQRNIEFGIILGLLIGTGFAYLRDRLDSSIQNSETLEQVTGVSVLADIPLDPRLSKNPCISFGGDRSATAEAFRTLRTDLQFLDVASTTRVIVVACAEAGEGKSVTAVNVALALAHAGRTVALVDGDLRNPNLHNLLDVYNAIGFGDVLSGQVPLRNAMQQTEFTGLSILTSGVLPPNPGEILGSAATKALLSDLRESFDYVILDSSPLLAVSDAAILATESDGVLVVCRFGTTRRDRLSVAVRRLNKVGARVLGAVLTMIPADRDSSNRGYLRYARKAAARNK